MASNRVDRTGCNTVFVAQAPVVEKVDGVVSSEFFKVLAEGDKKIEPATFKQGYKAVRYNRERGVVESVLVEKDCIVDEQWKWDTKERRWMFDETLWDTARDIPPPPPKPAKPPGFWAKLWAKLFSKAVLPEARLLLK